MSVGVRLRLDFGMNLLELSLGVGLAKSVSEWKSLECPDMDSCVLVRYFGANLCMYCSRPANLC